MPRTTQTAIFLLLVLCGMCIIRAAHFSWGAPHPTMWMPGLAGLIVQALRGEPPRAMGFRFTGIAPWLVGFLYPFGIFAACIALAYAVQTATGSAVICFRPESVHGNIFGIEAAGMPLVWLRLARSLLLPLPWLALALAYRYELPEKLGLGRHLARLLLWAQVCWFYPLRPLSNRPAWWLPPGVIGDEFGWRGWLVRRWSDRPLVALALSACAWSAFHLRVVIDQPALHALVPALAFLLSIAAAAAASQALYLWSGSVWPPIVAHVTWNFWNPILLGNQYGPGTSIFDGAIWLINGEGLLGTVVNGAVTIMLVIRWRSRRELFLSADGRRGER